MDLFYQIISFGPAVVLVALIIIYIVTVFSKNVIQSTFSV